MTEMAAFGMLLKPGMADEYRRRHDAIWPELAAALRRAGVIDYHIFLGADEISLFAVMRRRRDHDLGALRESELMHRWWTMMADIMETHPDGAPVEHVFREMFDLGASA